MPTSPLGRPLDIHLTSILPLPHPTVTTILGISVPCLLVTAFVASLDLIPLTVVAPTITRIRIPTTHTTTTHTTRTSHMHTMRTSHTTHTTRTTRTARLSHLNAFV